MHSVSVQEAKERLSELIEEAMQGNEVVILKEAKPAVKLVAVAPAPPPGGEHSPLQGTVLRYDRPTDPVADEDWEAAQ